MQLERDAALQPVELSESEAEFSLVSVLQGRLLEAFEEIPDRLRKLSEFELCAEVDPNPSDYKMRQNFSDAVEVAKSLGKKIRVTSVYEDVVARQTFFDLYVGNPLKVSFFMRPVVTHTSYYDAIHKEGLRKLFLYIRNHDLDPKTMATFAKIVEKAGDRVIGAVAQRIQMAQKQEITHIAGKQKEDAYAEDPELLEAKIREMQSKLSRAKPIEIEARTVITHED